MHEVSIARLYLLRAAYLFIAVGFGMYILPTILHPDHTWELMEGVVKCMLIAFWGLSIFGLRYPLQMLPVLLWELVWKTIWLGAIALPLWRSGQMDEATQSVAISNLYVIIIPIVIPWRYLAEHYFKKAGDPWRRRAT